MSDDEKEIKYFKDEEGDNCITIAKLTDGSSFGELALME
jgi:hypothetical protein